MSKHPGKEVPNLFGGPLTIDRMLRFNRAMRATEASRPAPAPVQAILDAFMDYQMVQVRHKMQVHSISFEEAVEMQLKVIIAEGEAMKAERR